MKIKNKKGEKVISVYWFAILFIVAGGVVYMASIFYKPLDIRAMETDILIDNVADCISHAGYINEEFLNLEENSEDLFLEFCSLNFNVEDIYDWKSQGQYYVSVDVKDFEDKEPIKKISSGNSNLADFCFSDSKNFPYCSKRKFYSIDKQGEQYIVEVLALVRKTEKN